MEHIGEMVFCDFDGEGFYLAGPEGRDARPYRRQREAADPIEEAPQSQHGQAIPWVGCAGSWVTSMRRMGIPSLSASRSSTCIP